MAKMENESSKTNTLTLLLRDSYGGPETPEIQIIKEPSTLKTFFSKINRTRKPGLAVPKIDFAKEMVIILCSGERSGDLMPSLYLGEETHEQMIIGVKEENDQEKLGSTAVTAPFCVYKMPLTHKEVTFRKNGD